MVEANPYTAPTADIESVHGEYGAPAVFSFKSRAGRLRYLARAGIATICAYLLAGIVVGAVIATDPSALPTDPEQVPDRFLGAIIAAYAVMGIAGIYFGLLFAIQRLHDLGNSGWLSLLIFVPLANFLFFLYLLFARGEDGENGYGPPPPPNTIGVMLGALIFPLLFILGVVAAIAIPAYQDFLTAM